MGNRLSSTCWLSLREKWRWRTCHDPVAICYLEVFGHKLVIHLSDGRVEQLNYSLSQARELLPQDRFLQCHRSYLVNKQAVRSLRRYEITLGNGEVVPVSKQRYREVEEELGAR